jgi:alpha-galactosidase
LNITIMRSLLTIALGLSLAAPALAQDLLAPTPPMGWNSWDSFGTTVTEDEVKANADYMGAHLRAWSSSAG